MPETKLKQFASEDGQMAAQVVSTDKGLQVRLRKLPNFNQLGNSLSDAKRKMIKRKKGPEWTEEDERRLEEIQAKIIAEEELDLRPVLDS